MKRAEDDFSVAARVQRELTAREEDEKAAARRRELEPPSRLTRPAEAPEGEQKTAARAHAARGGARDRKEGGYEPGAGPVARRARRPGGARPGGGRGDDQPHVGGARDRGAERRRRLWEHRLRPRAAADAERLAADRTYDQRRELLARASHRPDDSNRLRAAALRQRAEKQGDRAAGLYFAANNGHILDEARDVERARR